MLTYLLGPVLVLLPESYRRRLGWWLEIDWVRAALLSGAAQSVAGLGLLVDRYLDFVQRDPGKVGTTILEATGERVAASTALGTFTILEFLIQPLTLLLIYVSIEGALRLVAAVATEEAVGSLPLYLLELGRTSGAKVTRQIALGRLVADEVTRKGSELHIASCRERDAWDSLLTIEYEEQFYELAETRSGAPPRPYLYRLRPIPPGKIIRGLHHYRPDELLPPEKNEPKPGSPR